MTISPMRMMLLRRLEQHNENEDYDLCQEIKSIIEEMLHIEAMAEEDAAWRPKEFEPTYYVN